MELGRIILMTDGETHSLIRRKWLTKIFVCGDVLSFMTQASGTELSTTFVDQYTVSNTEVQVVE